MPYQPSSSAVHIDYALTNFSLAYLQDESGFVADKVFPIVPVDKQTNKYFTYPKDTFLRAGGAITPFGVMAPQTGFTLSSDSYSADVWRWSTMITPDVRANADSALSNIDQQAAMVVTKGLLIQREVQWGSTYFTTGIWGTNKTGGTDFVVWNDQSGSDPISDVLNGKATVLENTGIEPNTLTVGYNVHKALIQHPMLLERIKYNGGPTNPAMVTNDMIAQVFGLDKYLVAKSVQATNAEGQSVTTAFVLGNHALLTYSAPAPGLMTPSAGYNFVWSNLTGLNNMGIATFRTPMPWLGQSAAGVTELIEGQFAFDMKATATDLGYFFSAATSA